MHLKAFVLAAAFAGQAYASQAFNELAYTNRTYKYVATFSVDGLHHSDVKKYVKLRPASSIAQMLNNSYIYSKAYTSAPSDSLPGILAQFTGARPRTTGVWYDEAYDSKYFLPFSQTKSDCQGPAGAAVIYNGNIDYNSTELFSGGINPDNLPQTLIDGKCTKVYPHQRLRVNTIWEVAHAAGLKTAYTDKHPVYDIVRGPSGKGLSVGYFPEIGAVGHAVKDTITYDQYHVDAFLSWISGTTPEHSEVQDALNGPPNLFGGNFQSFSVAQQKYGYVAKTLTFTPELLKALDFIDASFASIIKALKDKGIYQDTLIVVASKHGQTPIDPTKFAKVSPSLVTAATGVKVSYQTSDDIALLFLANKADTDAAVAGLNKARFNLRIQDIIYGPQLIAKHFGHPANDSAIPDIIVRPVGGVLYTDGDKIANHGGLGGDSRHVACFVHAPDLKHKKFKCRVSTRRVGPTILKLLGLDHHALLGAKADHTKVLHGFSHKK